MARKFLTPIDLNKNELQNPRAQNLASAPASPVSGQFYYDTSTSPGILYWYDGTTWQSAKGGSPTGGAGGDLTGTYPNPTIVASAVTNAKLANMAANSFKGNNTGSSAAALDLTVAQAKTLLAIVPGDVTGFDTQVRTSTLNQMTAPTADLSINSHKLTNVTDPTSAQDAATKAYVDALGNGVQWKAPVRAATTANVATLAGGAPSTVDGVSLALNDRILVKAQTTGSQNGIYTVTTVGTGANGTWTRATDADANAEVIAGLAVFVEEGTTNADTGWTLTTDGAIVVGTTALTFTQFTSLGQITAGAALTKTGSTLDVAVDTTTIEVSSDALRIAAGAAGAGLTGGGGSALAVGAGTGISVAADSVAVDTALVARWKTGLIGNGSLTSITINHALANQFVLVGLYDASTGAQIEADVVLTDANNATVTFAAAPASNAIRYVIVG